MGSMAEPITPLPLTSSRADQIFPTLTSVQIARVASHGRTARSSPRRGSGRTRGSSHSIFRGHFRRTRGGAADMRNRNAHYDRQSWSVHWRNQYTFGPSCAGADSCAARWRSYPASSRKCPHPGANGCRDERGPDARIHSSARGVAGARYR